MFKPIISFLVLILSIGFAFFYVVPAYNLSQTRNADIETLAKILSTSGEIRTLIDKTKKNLSSIESDNLTRFGVFLPESVDPIRFANNIQYIGRKDNIILSGIKVEESATAPKNTLNRTGALQGLTNVMSLGAKMNQAESTTVVNSAGSGSQQQEKKYATTKATFTFPATYETFQLLLNDLEKSLGLIDLTSLSFAPLSDSADAKKSQTQSLPTYQFTMAIETYSLR